MLGRREQVLDQALDLEELEEIVGRAVERAASRLRGRSPLELAAEVHQVYAWLEKATGDKQLAVELTRIVYCEAGGRGR